MPLPRRTKMVTLDEPKSTAAASLPATATPLGVSAGATGAAGGHQTHLSGPRIDDRQEIGRSVGCCQKQRVPAVSPLFTIWDPRRTCTPARWTADGAGVSGFQAPIRRLAKTSYGG
jgi:hypothetical protein